MIPYLEDVEVYASSWSIFTNFCFNFTTEFVAMCLDDARLLYTNTLSICCDNCIHYISLKI